MQHNALHFLSPIHLELPSQGGPSFRDIRAELRRNRLREEF